MATLPGPTPTFPFPPVLNHRQPTTRSKPTTAPDPYPGPDTSPSPSITTLSKTQQKWAIISSKNKVENEAKELVNNKIASKKAISVILRREATKAVIEKRKGISSKRLLPRTVLEALHERITALRWDSALKVMNNEVQRRV